MKWIYQMNRVRVSRGDKLILDDVTLAFLPGAKIGVVDPNGAGKSTVLKIMAGLEQLSNGDATLAPDVSVGILLQEPPLDETKTVLGNVESLGPEEQGGIRLVQVQAVRQVEQVRDEEDLDAVVHQRSDDLPGDLGTFPFIGRGERLVEQHHAVGSHCI
ncbi:MAG: ATP-binding cassette domain-containing protein, partial [Pseudonocardiaceae bacterium]